MSNTITLNEPDVDSLLASWQGLRLERGASATNLASFTLVAQIPYVAHQTTYVYEDTAGAPTDWYRFARYAGMTIGTYSPPWPVKLTTLTTGDGARRSYKNCRRMLARRLGSLQLVLATADGNDAGTSFIARALANQLDANRYRSWWIMPADGVSAGDVRVLAENAVNIQSGQVSVQPGFTAKIMSGTSLELHKLLPPDEQIGPLIGLRQCLNLALAELWVLDRLAVVGTGLPTVDISQLGDWLDPTATYELYAPDSTAMPPMPFGAYRTYRDGAVINMDAIGLAPGSATNLELTRPGDSYIKQDGVWTDSQQGFVNDDDECLFQPTFVVEVALAYAYEALANGSIGAPQVRYQGLASDQRIKANTIKRVPGALPRPPQYDRRPSIGDEFNAGYVDYKSYWSR